MQVVLINPYELGRQPFGLAEPAAWLARDGHQVVCVDLALERLERSVLERADLVGLHLAMHTATRIAVEAMPRIRAAAPHARVFAYGLYAPVNAAMLRDIGIDVVLGGEAEPDIAELARRLAAGDRDWQPAAAVNLSRIPFVVPDRTGLPALTRYARLLMPDGSERVVGFLEATRGASTCADTARWCRCTRGGFAPCRWRWWLPTPAPRWRQEPSICRSAIRTS